MDGQFAFNTAIAAVMTLIKDVSRIHHEGDASTVARRFALSTAASLLFPFAPHTASEVYEHLTGDRVWEQEWPVAEERYLRHAEISLPVQVDGKVRFRIVVPADADEELLRAMAVEAPELAEYLRGRTVARIVAVPGKIVNVIAAKS